MIAACDSAKRNGAIISADLNFRAKLWSPQKAQSIMIPLMDYVDVCIANEEDAEKSLGFKASKTNVEHGELDESGYFEMAKTLKDQFKF